MKKIKLTANDFSSGEAMSRSDLKKVVGGVAPPATVSQKCASTTVSCTSPTGNVGYVWNSTRQFTIGVICDGVSFTCPVPPGN